MLFGSSICIQQSETTPRHVADRDQPFCEYFPPLPVGPLAASQILRLLTMEQICSDYKLLTFSLPGNHNGILQAVHAGSNVFQTLVSHKRWRREENSPILIPVWLSG